MNTNPESKRILCYGDSNTWGWIPGQAGKKRFTISERWPGILQDELGANFEVIEEGLGARTISTDDPRPELPLRNGESTLSVIMEAHLPIDILIIMLGTTETKPMFGLSAEDIAIGMRSLIEKVKNNRVLANSIPPKILLVSPPVVNEKAPFARELFKGGTTLGEELTDKLELLAKELKVSFLNSHDIAKVNISDGVHLDAEGHKKLGYKIAEIIKNL